jgi:hypothetical protein
VTARPHEPKLRALAASNRRQLSAASEARLAKHLAACDICREAQTGQRLAEHLIGEVDRTDPAVDFAKIEAGLERVQLRDRRRRLLAIAVLAPLVAAAAGLLYLARSSPTPAPSPVATARPSAPQPPIAAPDPPPYPASITALSGPGTLEQASGDAVPLRVDMPLEEGDRLVLGERSVAHLRLDHASGCVAGPASDLRLLRVREGQAELALERGRLTNQVQPLTAAQHYRIRAAGYVVSVRGTRFEVSVAGDKLDVMVVQGHVIVEDAAGQLVADLHARDHFATDPAFGARLATRDPSQPALSLEQPRGLGVSLEAWALLTLLDVASLERFGVTALSLDGTRFPIPGELALRVPPGDVTLVVERLTVAPQKLTLHVPPEGLSIAPDALRRLLKLYQRENAAAPPTEIDFKPVLAVVHAGTAGLQRCYERALKQRPDLDGRLTMRVSIEPNGRVSQALPRSQTATLPADLVECMRNVSGQWRFPATGAPLAFDVPLRLQPR